MIPKRLRWNLLVCLVTAGSGMVNAGDEGYQADAKSGLAGEVRRVADETPSPPSLIERYTEHALTNQGDSTSGQRLFQQQAVTRCLVCHRVNRSGGDIGPNLSSIGGKFDRPHLIESLLQPSEQIVEGYRVTHLALEDGKVLSGIIKSESETSVQLVDGEAKWHRVSIDEIEERKTSSVSLMPEGLIHSLTPEQFTDLIAYLETLRGSGNGSDGDIAEVFRAPGGFTATTVATGLTAAATLDVLPDGRVLISEQTGQIRMVKDGQLLPEPILSTDIERNRERGLLGVAVDPDFPEAPYIYTCRVRARPHTHHCISRWTLEGEKIDPQSELILLEGDNQRYLGGNDPASAQGGAVHFGPDGCLYVSIGDQTASTPARSLNSLLGKILRINKDGSIPEDNPFYEQTQGKYRAIWAMGLRNPFSFAFRPGSNSMFVNDVGGRYEEINVLSVGSDAGWPRYQHGPTRGDDFASPIHYYPQSCVCGSAFAPESWPAPWGGRYFFADFVQGWVRAMNPDDATEVLTFVQRLQRPVDMQFTADGTLYILVRNAWVFDGRFRPNTGSLVAIRPTTNDSSPRVAEAAAEETSN